jgi:putative ABC transport system substrate-binding protein
MRNKESSAIGLALFLVLETGSIGVDELALASDQYDGAGKLAIRDLLLEHILPAIYFSRFFVTDGGLVSYGVDRSDSFRRAAVYVDRILRGAKSADLPVEGPTKFELVINLKTAKALGLDVPPSAAGAGSLIVAARHESVWA